MPLLSSWSTTTRVPMQTTAMPKPFNMTRNLRFDWRTSNHVDGLGYRLMWRNQRCGEAARHVGAQCFPTGHQGNNGLFEVLPALIIHGARYRCYGGTQLALTNLSASKKG